MTHNTTHTQIAIIGGGISGICTAYFMAQAGFDVALFERRSNVAEEATLGNSGLMAPASTSPLALPGIISTALTSQFQSSPAIMTKSGLNPSRWSWHRRSSAQALHEYAQNKSYLTSLTAYGQSLIHQLQEQHSLDEENVEGILRVFRKQDDFQRATAVEDILKQQDLPYADMEIAQIAALEPTFILGTTLASAKYYAQDEVGNCVLFVKQLKNIVQTLGVQFHFSQSIKSIERHTSGKITLHTDSQQTFTADAVILTAGMQSAQLLKPLGVALPLYPVESYTAVATLKTTEYAPSTTLIDESYRVSIARLGNRLRISGLMGFVPHTKEPHKLAAHTLTKIANDYFPNAVNYNNAKVWGRTFALMPNGLPLLSTTSYGNIFVNTAHGMNGWAAAVGTAKILTDHIMDHDTEIDTSGLISHL